MVRGCEGTRQGAWQAQPPPRRSRPVTPHTRTPHLPPSTARSCDTRCFNAPHMWQGGWLKVWELSGAGLQAGQTWNGTLWTQAASNKDYRSGLRIRPTWAPGVDPVFLSFRSAVGCRMLEVPMLLVLLERKQDGACVGAADLSLASACLPPSLNCAAGPARRATAS